ncbi:Kelch-like protein 26 [Harpegnathos saltator]|uniref:Kelch-like protein 26 n=1 Tax=Harpegnathos saltator TaxID=610380 RepID=E2BM20_HARSA|nr:Kelch-like protein 26 [Harpegnathos saltator]
MRRGCARYDDRQLDTSITAEDDSCFSSELDLLNPRRLMYCGDNRKESSTPRIVRVIRQNSRKRDLKVGRSAASDRPREDNSKSSVVVLYHGRSSTPPSSTSKLPLRLSKSDQTIAAVKSDVLQPETTSSASPDKTRLVETPESQSPRYPLPRRKFTSRRYRRPSKQQHSLHVNIYHENQVERLVSALQHPWIVPERQIGEGFKELDYAAKSFGIPIKREEKTTENAPGKSRRKRIEEKQVGKKQCSPVDEAIASKSMDYRPRQAEADDARGQKQAVPCSNLSSLAQRTQTRPKGANPTCISVNETNEASRVFPFRATPSGNLKIIPNQVVFESKKFSVLVADPRRTRVNVKAELSRSAAIDTAGTLVPDSSNRPRYVDLPLGVTPSAIDQLQAQKKLPYIEANYKSRIQPSTKFTASEMAEKQPAAQPMSHQVPAMNEIPLASLGFTNEQPINWEDIILPEKTDLYQELAKRITNYKNADCIVRIDHDEFCCHLLVLQSYSTFFDEKNCKDIDLSGSNVTSKAFSIIYDWMISPTSESYQLLRRDNILEIFMAAQYLGIKELEEQCWAFIDNDELFSEDTAFLLYLEAKKIGNTAVMELMVPRIMKFFLMLVSTKDFLELSVDELCLLLKSNYICVNSEMEVLMSAVRWLMHDWNGRKQHMLEVLRCVRFGLIAPWQLIDVKRNPENPEFMELMSYPEVQKMVDDGLAFVIIKYWYGNQTEDYYHWIDVLGLNEPTNRNWAGEDKNYVTYREFLLYLEDYQKTKVTELKTRKKPTPPSSPPKDYSPLSPGRMHTDCGQNHCCIESRLLERYSTTQGRGSKKYISRVATSSGTLISPEILTECLSNMGRNNNVRANKVQCDGNRNGNSNVHETRFHGAGESPRRSLDFFKRHTCDNHQNCENQQGRKQVSDVYSRKPWEHNAMFPTKKQQKAAKKSRYSENRDSVKSEEEAATMIQATYRGYKVRRKFDEIKKSSSEEKQNAQKVAELLSATTSRCGRFFQKRSTKPSQSVQ